jgi:hypothetical protein
MSPSHPKTSQTQVTQSEAPRIPLIQSMMLSAFQQLFQASEIFFFRINKELNNFIITSLVSDNINVSRAPLKDIKLFPNHLASLQAIVD